jgi:ribose transport system substrate-binding protein
MFGYLASKWMHELATKPGTEATLPADHLLDTGVDVIEKANVADFKAKLIEMKKGS